MREPQFEAHYRQRLQSSIFPAIAQDALVLYLVHGLPPGHFLEAVLSNDLIEAVKRADDTNIDLLPAYVRWLYQHAPVQAWGTAERVGLWIDQHARLRASDEQWAG